MVQIHPSPPIYPWVVQLVEHMPEEHGVGGSIPSPGAIKLYVYYKYSDMFITPNHNTSDNIYFSGTDSDNIFKKNKKVRDKDWIYHTKEISYHHDEFGFRIKQFGDQRPQWEESIVVFGCSNVYGIGLAYEDTFCSQLEQMLKIPVINLGVPGSAVDMSARNSYILYKHFPHPNAIVHLWTELSRYTDWSGKNNSIGNNHVPSNSDYYPNINWEAKSMHLIDLDRELWRNKTIYYEGTFWFNNSISLNIDMINMVDTARDCSHPGIKTNYFAAMGIAERLKSLGI